MGKLKSKLDAAALSVIEQMGIICGTSQAMCGLLNDVARIAKSDLPVMITGETGSGKEVIACLLHRLGCLSESPFLDVNCAAIPEALIESQLFGHEKGAFTGATSKQDGYFTLASDGLLFLDEVAELPLWQQTKLLRVLETRQYRPVGASLNLHFRGRIVTATHVDIEKRVADKQFREDLFYRLNVVNLRVPSLHERRDDIPYLVKHFCKKNSRNIKFSEKAMILIQKAQWNGNVRELKNMVDKISLMSESDYIDTEEVSKYITICKEECRPSSRVEELAASLLLLDIPNKLEAFEHAAIMAALENSNGNKSSAARELGVHRKYIERRLNNLDAKLDEIQQLQLNATKKMGNSQYKEAVKDLRLALHKLDQRGLSKDLDDLKLDLLLKLSTCQRSLHGWNNAEVISLYKDACGLTESRDNSEQLTSAHFGLWANQLVALDLEGCIETAAEYWREGERGSNPNVCAQATISLANTHFWMGEYHQVNADLQQFIGFYNHDRRMVIDIGHDPFVYYLMFKALTAFQMGKVTLAVNSLDELIRYSREINQPFSLATAVQTASWLSYKLGDSNTCYEYALELRDISRNHDFRFFEGIADIFIGHQTALDGDYLTGRNMIERGFTDKLNGGKGRLFSSMYGIILADSAIYSQNFEQGLEDIERTIAVSIEQKERCYLAEELVMRGRLKLALKKNEEAAKDFNDALTESHERGSKAAELKAAHALADNLFRMNLKKEARRVLTPVVLRFTEQKSYRDLTQAKSLLSLIDDNPDTVY